MRAGIFGVVVTVAAQVVTLEHSARADAPPLAQAAAPPTDDAITRGRAAYVRGQALAKDEHWGDALAAFQEAAAARDAPLVEFNIAYCERALGRYVAARKTLQGTSANTTGLDPAQIDDIKAYLAEFDRVIVRVAVQLDPDSATLTVDGRPLIKGESEGEYLGGVAPAAVGAPLGKATFTMLLDPGAHVVRAVREGHQDIVVLKSYRPGERAPLDLHLDVLPAIIAIRSDPPLGIVRVDAREVGVAPIEFQRPAGKYKLEVMLDHYETYSAALDLLPGQRSDLTAHLNPYTVPIVKRWWFWTAAAVVVAGGATLTYFLTRPAPAVPAYQTGSEGWLVQAQSLRW